MFDEGQRLPSAYHRTKFESEKIVREECPVPWRVYRPAVVVGHSETGAMDKIDGPYYFFPVLKRMRDTLPNWMPLLGIDLVHFGVVIVLNIMVGLITPPYGLVLFVINSVAGVPLKEMIAEVWQFIAVLVLVLLMLVLFPDLVLWLPRQLGYA